MKRIFTIILMVQSLLLAPIAHAQTYWNGTADKEFSGMGTEADPYLITTAEELAGLAARVNDTTNREDFAGKYFKLTNDLYLTDFTNPDTTKWHEWEPIGKWTDISNGPYVHKFDTCWFRGNFDGANHTIHNVYMGTIGDISIDNPDAPWEEDVIDFTGMNRSFFGFVDKATIQNLTIENMQLRAMGSLAGLIVQASNSRINHCYVINSHLVQNVNATDNFGGLIGSISASSIDSCGVDNTVLRGNGMGGLVCSARNGSVITNSYANTSQYGILQQVNSYELMGQVYGFISNNDDGCLIKNSQAHIEHIGGDLGRGAGFAARNSGIIQECSASGYVKTGIVNYNEGSGFCNTNVGRIESCYTTVDVYSNHIDGYVASFVFNNGGSRIEYSQLLEDAQGVIINCLALGHCFILNKDHNKQPYTFLHATNNTIPYGGTNSLAIGCFFNNDSVVQSSTNFLTDSRGTYGLTAEQFNAQSLVDTLNMIAAVFGTSTWEYRAGQHPIPTGTKATNSTDYFAGGNGTKESPFLIETKKHLENLRALVGLGADFKDMYFKQIADINFNVPFEQWGEVAPEKWTPIADTRNEAKFTLPNYYIFRGTYDGGFHELRNMYINNNKNDQGLFSCVGGGARIKNLGVTDVYIKQPSNSAATLVGCFAVDESDIVISQCWTSGYMECQTACAIVGTPYISRGVTLLNCQSSVSLENSKTEHAGMPRDAGITSDRHLTGNYLFTGTMAEKHDKYSGFSVALPCHGYSTNINTYYDTDVYPHYGTADLGRPTAYLQSKDFVNILNSFVYEWNTTHDEKLDYWKHSEGKYPQVDPTYQPPYLVTFETNGGSNINPMPVDVDTHIFAPQEPKKDGYIFAGWYADAAFKQVFVFDSILIKGNTTIYAKWLTPTMDTYDVTPFQNEFAKEFHIKNKAQLIGFIHAVNGIDGVLTANSFEGKTVYLDCDILLNDTADWKYWGTLVRAETWTPIGKSYAPFLGTFDGQGHKIIGMYIESPIGNYNEVSSELYHNRGLFGWVGTESKEGHIRNLGIQASTFDFRKHMDTGSNIGLLVGTLRNGTISQCFTQGKIVGDNVYYAIGGLVGQFGDYSKKVGTISDCYTCVDIVSTSQGLLGGVIGRNEGAALNNSFATGRGWRYGASTGSIANVYYDKQINTTALQNSGTGLSTNEMHAKSTFVGFDFDSIWGRNDTINDGYPYLRCFYTEHIPDSPDPVKVTGIELQETSLSVVAGAKIQLHANVLPADAPEKGIIWSIRNDVSGMAEVDENGKVTTHYLSSYAGQTKKAYVTATTLEGNYQKTCTLSISYPSLAVAATKQHRRVGTTAWSAWNTNESTKKSVNWEYLVAIYLNPDSLHQTITYTNSNPDVASFEIISHDTIIPNFNSSSGAPIRCALGVLTCQVAGSTTITATHSEGYTKSTSFTVAQYSINGISISMPNATIYPGDTVQLKANTNPTYASDKPESYTWSSGNESIFEVNELGQLIAKKPGTTTVKLTSTNPSYSTSKSVTVASVPATSITIIPSEITIGVGDTARLSVVFEPLNATEKDFSWSSNNTRYATISRIAGSTDGLLKGVKVGSATIRATTPSTLTTASLSASCKVTIVEKYSVRFYDWDGTLLKSQRVLKGSAATAPVDPVREGYTFTGWDKDFSNVQSDLTVTAQYEQNAPNPIYYTVIFQDWDGTTLKTEQVEQGKSATAPATPVREGYTFVGWDKDFSNVQSDLTVTAQYKKIIIYYTITFVNEDGTVLQTSQVAEGEMPVYTGETPMKATTVEYTYTFIGWTPEFAPVTTDATYTATYTATKRKYQIHFLNYNGVELQSSEVEYGALPEYMGETPTRPSTAQYNYVFDGWNPEIVSVTKDANYTATYVSFLRQYTVTFMDWDGKILSEQVVDFGSAAIAPAAPTREGYTFKGWDKDFSNVQSDLIVIAQYEKNPESAVEDIEAQENSVRKVMENQQLFIILPDGSKYSATGQKL